MDTSGPDHPDELWPSELEVSDAVGRLIEFWGFKRNMGRVWTVLYLAGRPLAAMELRDRLKLSAGAVSMTVTDLVRWGVVRKVWIQGERKEFFAAEGNLWKMISRVMRERERVEIAEAIVTFERAVAELRRRETEGTADDRHRAQHGRRQVEELLDLAKTGQTLLDALLENGRVDLSPLVRRLLGAK